MIMLNTIAQFLILFIQLILLFLLVVLTYLMARGVFGVPYVRTKKKHSKTMLEMLNLKPGQTLIDFGSGDGSILIHSAKHHETKGIGFEYLWVLVQWAKIRTFFTGTSKSIKFKKENFLKSKKLPEADAISIYLFPEVNVALEPLLIRDYPKGTKVVSRTFKFPTLNLLETKETENQSFYLYEI